MFGTIIDWKFHQRIPASSMLSDYRSIKNGNTIKETAKILDIDARTGSRWLKRYNEMGIDGLKPKFELRGTKCKLSDEQLTILEEKKNEERNAFTIKKAQKFIKENI